MDYEITANKWCDEAYFAKLPKDLRSNYKILIIFNCDSNAN